MKRQKKPLKARFNLLTFNDILVISQNVLVCFISSQI
jgi:hypothetical protein